MKDEQTVTGTDEPDVIEHAGLLLIQHWFMEQTVASHSASIKLAVRP